MSTKHKHKLISSKNKNTNTNPATDLPCQPNTKATHTNLATDFSSQPNTKTTNTNPNISKNTNTNLAIHLQKTQIQTQTQIRPHPSPELADHQATTFLCSPNLWLNPSPVNPKDLEYLQVGLSTGRVGSVLGPNQTRPGWIKLLNFGSVFNRIFGLDPTFRVIGYPGWSHQFDKSGPQIGPVFLP